MKKTLLVLNLAFVSINAFTQQTNETITIGGAQRSYIQYIPLNFDPATEELPVVFVLHGLGGSALEMTGAGMNLIADTARFILVYPQGVANGFGNSSWNNGTAFLSSTADDLGFFNAMIDNYLANFSADVSRIYMSGLSMGAIMSHHLACKLNNRVAAIGTMSGTIASSTLDFHMTNTLSYKTPVIHFHGTADGVVPYAGAGLPSLELVEPTMNFWKNVHGCANTADSIRLPDTAADNLTVDRFVYNDCDIEGALELWRINGGGHTYFYEPLNDFTEAIEIWLFFARWSHPNASPLGISEQYENNVTVFPNPSEGKISLNGIENKEVFVFDATGKSLEVFQLDATNQIDLSGYQSGLYFIQSETMLKPVSVVLK